MPRSSDAEGGDPAGACGAGALTFAWPRYQDFSLEEEVTRHYFPEQHGFRHFGDPYERKREREQRQARG